MPTYFLTAITLLRLRTCNCENSQHVLAISSIKDAQGMKSLLDLDLTRQY